MKIIEALKEVKLIEKKIVKNNETIMQYSSQLSNEKPYIGDEKEQTKYVKELIQSNLDLIDRSLILKLKIEKTNNSTIATKRGKREYTITELLAYKRRIGAFERATFSSLTEDNAKRNMAMFRGNDSGISIIRFYDEKSKNEKLGDWLEFSENIDGLLEVLNASTDIVE